MANEIRTATTSQLDETSKSQRRSGLKGLAVTGGILSAIAASSCCVLPLALAVFGVGGAWMSGLRALAPYQPLFISLAVGAIGFGFIQVYWKEAKSCEDAELCARPMPNRLAKFGLWLATAIVGVVVSFPYWFGLVEPYLP